MTPGITCGQCRSFIPPHPDDVAAWNEGPRRRNPKAGPCPGACWVAFLKEDDPRARRGNHADSTACPAFDPIDGKRARQLTIL